MPHRGQTPNLGPEHTGPQDESDESAHHALPTVPPCSWGAWLPSPPWVRYDARMRTRRIVSHKMPVASVLVIAAGLSVACKKDEPEDRPLPEPLPVFEAGAVAAKAPAAPSLGAMPPAQPAPAQPRNEPTQPTASQAASTGQPQEAPAAATTATTAPTATTAKPADTAAPASTSPSAVPVPSASPAQLAKCLEKCNSVLSACVKRLTQPDAGTPSAATIASCTKAQSECQAACM